MCKVEFCFVDAKGIHNKLYEDKDVLKKDMELIEKLRPDAPTSLYGKHKVTGKPHRVTKGTFNWDDTNLIVEVILVDENGQPVSDKDGVPILFTYITRKYVDMPEKLPVKTARGNRTAIVASPCRRKTNKEIGTLAASLGYSKLVVLQDVIIKE